VDTDTITEPSGTCRCAVEATRTTSRTYSVAPADGGGWPAWTAAFTRLLGRLAVGPTHCVVVTQEPNQRYVQMMLGHGHAHLEASSNAYLVGDFRLAESDEAALADLGFLHPDDLADDSGLPENWWIDHDVADPTHIAQLLTATVRNVMAFDEHWPVTIDVFGADSPCEVCFWET
jgi:T3SS (YopN, CesT) and YbjN peptide-binding chaperone 3